MRPKITVDIVSDIVCPWCYIGIKRFEKAVEQLKDQFDFEIDFKAFQLHPEINDSSINLMDYLVSKYGDSDKVSSMTNQVISDAHEEGIEMNFPADKIIPNTLLAHKLLKLIPNKILKAKVKKHLLKAYFTDNVDIGNQQEIYEIAKNAGISQIILDDFNQNTNVKLVLEEQKYYRKAGITAVPSFIINGKHLVQGAQSKDTFISAFQQLGNPTPSKNSCTPGSGCC
jgi:predicted DsbA family dithiol-disulfide isomerase